MNKYIMNNSTRLQKSVGARSWFSCNSTVSSGSDGRQWHQKCGCLYPATPVAAENIVTSLLGTPPTVSFCLCFLECRDFSLWPTNSLCQDNQVWILTALYPAQEKVAVLWGQVGAGQRETTSYNLPEGFFCLSAQIAGNRDPRPRTGKPTTQGHIWH